MLNFVIKYRLLHYRVITTQSSKIYTKSNANISINFTSIEKLLFNKYKTTKFIKNRIIQKLAKFIKILRNGTSNKKV